MEKLMLVSSQLVLNGEYVLNAMLVGDVRKKQFPAANADDGAKPETIAMAMIVRYFARRPADFVI